jgi:hypothetical protein
MSHWRKPNPPARYFNLYLKGWTVAVSAIFAVLIVLSLHGHA